jgi:predicted esterase
MTSPNQFSGIFLFAAVLIMSSTKKSIANPATITIIQYKNDK